VASQPRKGASARPAPSCRGASMGPWLRSHGRPQRRGGGPLGYRGFNGAVASQPRKGPAVGRLVAALGLLQWGRGFAATEGHGVDCGAAVGHDASMGPWLRSHGRRGSSPCTPVGKQLQWGRGFAATEGGNPLRNQRTIGVLQWGRGFAATEGEPA